MQVRITQDTRLALSLYGPFFEFAVRDDSWPVRATPITEHPTHEGANAWMSAIHDRFDLYDNEFTLNISDTMIEAALYIEDHLDWYGSVLSYIREDWSRDEAAQVERDLENIRRAIKRAVKP